METADAPLRWTRAVALAVVASLVAVWAHAGGGGHLPSARVLLLVVAALTVAAAPLLARPASAVRVVALTVGGQALAHAALSLTAGHRGDAAHGSAGPAPAVPTPVPLGVDGQGRRLGSLVDHARATPGLGDGGLSVPDPVSVLIGDLAAAGAPMLLAHLAAATVVGAWLAGGERAVWTLLTLAWRALVLSRPVAIATGTLRRAATPVAVPPLLLRAATGTVVRRGPPLLLAA